MIKGRIKNKNEYNENNVRVDALIGPNVKNISNSDNVGAGPMSAQENRINNPNANIVGTRWYATQRGITLIALIITIIILLILVGVTINVLIGDNGLFKTAKEAGEKYEEAGAREKLEAVLVELQADKIVKPEVYNEKEYIDSKLKENNMKVEEDIVTVEGWQFEIDRTVPKIAKELSKTDESQFTKIANAPDISGFNKSNTYYVAWNLNTSPYEIDESIAISETAPSNWYDYTSGTNHWANIKTTGGGNDCYWVWIPRYAYCITEGYHSNSAGTIDIKFLKGTTNTPIDGTNITISNSSGAGNWNVHPAFWWDKNNNGIEEEGEQLTGIWVAKFEASSNSPQVVENPTAEQLAFDGGSDTDTELKVRVKPNVTSWRGITVGNVFTVCRNLTTSGNSLENTNNIDSHMMKNTEWGAVVYLSRSVYGKNSPVWNNPYYNNETNYSPITGLAGNSQDASQTNLTNTYKYNEAEGGNASTTGNVYGVYDMAGGAWDYVAGILSSYKSNSAYYDFSNSDIYPNKYFDWYAGNSSDRNTNYNANINKYGDSVYETSSSGDSGTGSWDASDSRFPSTPVFLRGGPAASGSNAGVFAFNYGGGGALTHYSFRPVVLSSQS